MVNTELKKEAIELAAIIKNMSVPTVSLTPALTMSENDWAKFIYMMKCIKEEFEKKLNNPMIINIFDGVNRKEAMEKIQESIKINQIPQCKECPAYGRKCVMGALRGGVVCNSIRAGGGF